ncbi:MFS transporter [Kribbella jiaozuonensis]|uniref:Major facilitator superfamily domain-containing protein 7 n=1 Tax=Kribbella jiaozuonensis TaxID=2575441 RepID=A0A4U3M1Q2_9ACTN|nr:MFS transporter [Kribbella jiaozuonensis]TKK81919.1 major facilitator superfamily domain-containing protein 7 [Kribbella jiaozuonensis]
MRMRSQWPAIVGYSLVGAATQLVWLNFAGVTTVAADHYNVSESAIGWLAQVFPLLYVVLAIPCGLLLDRWFRPALIAGAVLTALGALVRLIGDDFSWLLAGQILASIAQPLVLNAVTGITGRYLSEKDRPTGIAVGTASIFAGMVIAFLLSAIFTTASSLPTMLWITAIFCVLAALVLTLVIRRPGPFDPAHPPVLRAYFADAPLTPQEPPTDPQAAPGAAHVPATAPTDAPPAFSGSTPPNRPDRGALAAAWGDPLIRRLCVLALFPFGVFVAMSTFAQALLEPAGVSGGTASTILLVNVIAGVLGSAIIPILVVRRQAESTLLVISLTATAAACVLLALAPGVLTGFVAITLIGLLLLPALPIVLELVERRTGEAEGTAAGLIWMSGNLGGLIVAVVVGLLVDHPPAAFLVMAAIALIAVPGARALRRPIAELRSQSRP